MKQSKCFLLNISLVARNTQEYIKLNHNTIEVNYSNNKCSCSIQCEIGLEIYSLFIFYYRYFWGLFSLISTEAVPKPTKISATLFRDFLSSQCCWDQAQKEKEWLSGEKIKRLELGQRRSLRANAGKSCNSPEA